MNVEVAISLRHVECYQSSTTTLVFRDHASPFLLVTSNNYIDSMKLKWYELNYVF